jgi:uncharacterized protein
MPEDMIRYDLLVQEALRGVVRRVLMDASQHGLPGEHHFFISFRTKAQGVQISPRLLERHPEEMTIVLQHQFWDLIVSENGLEVGLSFGGIPEKLVVPFDAMSGFWDPSVDFGLKFELAGVESADNDTPEEKTTPTGDMALVERIHEATETPRQEGDGGAEIVSLSAFRKKT